MEPTENGIVSLDSATANESQTEAETPVSPSDAIDRLTQTLADREAVIIQLNASLDEAVAAYRASAAARNPAIPAEIITGDTVAAVDESVKKARALVEQVKAALKTAPPPVIAARRGATGTMTVEEKIRRGLGF
ncbi:hypothetical protein ABFB09_01955 [Dehalogenimonas sp. THU2]|uniref:hypothetical protein n=1 Tax=Dehalogenimonas sp. THU2 TaxID=3151121 RepID=UPI003218C516